MPSAARGRLARCCSLGLALAAFQAAAPAHAQVATLDADELRSVVQAHRGKVVVVNFWASWCPPCLEEFPDIIEVYGDYHEAGLEVIAVSMNAADETREIEAFLEDYQPPFAVYRADSVDETFYRGVVQPWFGEIPITLIFDTAGERIRYHRKALTYEELAEDVGALLSSSWRSGQ